MRKESKNKACPSNLTPPILHIKAESYRATTLRSDDNEDECSEDSYFEMDSYSLLALGTNKPLGTGWRGCETCRKPVYSVLINLKSCSSIMNGFISNANEERMRECLSTSSSRSRLFPGQLF